MKNGDYSNSCLFGEELVSYVYSELPSSARVAFENHLLNCSDCTDEFAVVSVSRLGIYEWHRDDFLPLETPVFEIPYARPVVASEPSIGWLDALRGLFSPARLAVTGGAFAVLAIAFGAIYVSLPPNGSLITDANKKVSSVSIPENPAPSAVKPQFAEKKDPEVNDVGTIQASSKPSQRTTRPVQAKLTKRNSDRQIQAKASQPAMVPRLGTYVETEDKSLRLADLVADIDTDDF